MFRTRGCQFRVIHTSSIHYMRTKMTTMRRRNYSFSVKIIRKVINLLCDSQFNSKLLNFVNLIVNFLAICQSALKPFDNLSI